jgi:hypothetical protein
MTLKLWIAFVFAVTALAAYAAHPHTASMQDDGVFVRAEAFNDERDGTAVIRVDVLVEDVQNIGAFQFVLSYDGDKVAIVDNGIERGPFLGSSGREVYCDEPTIDASALRYACVTLGGEPAEGASGDGTLVSVFFEETGDGNAMFSLSRVQLAEPAGDEIPVALQEGEIRVESDDSFPWLIVAVAAGAAVLLVAVVVAAIVRRRVVARPPVSTID